MDSEVYTYQYILPDAQWDECSSLKNCRVCQIELTHSNWKKESKKWRKYICKGCDKVINRASYEKHKDKQKRVLKAKLNTPEHWVEYILAHRAVARAKKLKLKGSKILRKTYEDYCVQRGARMVTTEEALELLERQEWKCAGFGCGLTLQHNTHGKKREAAASLDRVDVAGEYTADNVEWLCMNCNRNKNNTSWQQALSIFLKIAKIKALHLTTITKQELERLLEPPPIALP
jgi:hypothetical protein